MSNEINDSGNYGLRQSSSGGKMRNSGGSRAGGSETQEWVIEELDKYSEYEFVVQAYNVVGLSPFSDPITAITLEDGKQSRDVCLKFVQKRIKFIPLSD